MQQINWHSLIVHGVVKRGMKSAHAAYLSIKMKEFIKNCFRLENSIVEVKWKHDWFVKEMLDRNEEVGRDS
jgi:hypothetical protein